MTAARVTSAQVNVGDIIRAELDSANVITGEVVAKDKIPARFHLDVTFDRIWVQPSGTSDSLPLRGHWLHKLTFIRTRDTTPKTSPE